MIHLLLNDPKRAQIPTFIIVSALFVLNTIYTVTTIIDLEQTYIYNSHSHRPAGVPAITLALVAEPIGILNQACFVLGSLLADGFLVGAFPAVL